MLRRRFFYFLGFLFLVFPNFLEQKCKKIYKSKASFCVENFTSTFQNFDLLKKNRKFIFFFRIFILFQNFYFFQYFHFFSTFFFQNFHFFQIYNFFQNFHFISKFIIFLIKFLIYDSRLIYTRDKN